MYLEKAGKHVAIVTGCGKADGLGAATARALVQRCVAVAVSDLNAEGLRNAPENKGRHGSPHHLRRVEGGSDPDDALPAWNWARMELTSMRFARAEC